ncbi:GumC family protein [Calothrix sp. PCC 6303]|uniref:GumC family protein n=1 Tax=Calothrix sp. PCC 6303 TaxID=1170562 RepID=UPI0002A0140E|nr:polysaccharide biosynthesis tyrosine autokinase [Calothrix sp. PCC 6303]AFZ00170.1 capsular exopolysaccharide family [Calothrix sp. PCC 6303]
MENQESFTFDKYWHILKRRWVPGLGVFFPIFLLSLIASSQKKPTYEAEGKLQFQRNNGISTLTGVGTEVGKLESVAQDQKTSPLNTEAEVIRSLPIVNKTINTLNLKDDKGLPLKSSEFIKKLSVKDVKGTDILQVAYSGNDPKGAAEVVNSVMNSYVEHNVAFHRSTVTAARKFLERQVPSAELMVRKVEAELREFKEKNKLVSLQEEATKSIEMVKDLQRQINEIKSQIADTSAQAQSSRAMLGVNSQQAVAMTSLSQSEGVKDAVKELHELESQLATRRVILQDTHPEIINLQNKAAALKSILQSRVGDVSGSYEVPSLGNLQAGDLKQKISTELVGLESRRLGLASQLATLSGLEASYRQRLESLPRLEQQQRELERKVQAAQSTYSSLLQKLQESRITESQNLGNAQIISQAEVPDEAMGSPMVNYLSAGLLGLLASLATIYLVESRDKFIKNVDEAKEFMELTLLGVIPALNKQKSSLIPSNNVDTSVPRVVVRETPRSPISEAYRMLRSNLKFLSADKELKVIVVTSSVPKEGKSTVAANLAMAIAQMERKVLIVDGDLHRPSQHQIWDLPNSEGLSNVIVGQSDMWGATTQVMDNLYVLTSGLVPPSPASLLDSKRMATLIQRFAANFDFVIIDTPSISVAADAAALGQMADGVLFVVRPGVADIGSAGFAKDLLKKSGQNVLGQVVNAVDPRNENHSYYYFNDEYYSQDSLSQVQVAGIVD